MSEEIASTHLIAKNTAGESRELVICLLKPEPDPASEHGDQRCRVELTGFSKSTYTHGCDTLQALSIAHVYIRRELQAFCESGWELFHPDDLSDPFPFLSCYYPMEHPFPWEDLTAGKP
jgi:hypothetical protein